MAKVYYENDADLDLIRAKKVAIIGYGSQGHAHALNLRDSGVDVVVGLRAGSASWAKAEAAGLQVAEVADAVAQGDVVMILVPDQYQRTVYAEQIAPNLKPDAALFFAHGFNIRYGYIEADAAHDICMVAPKGPGHKVRESYVDGQGIPAIVAVEQDADGQAWPLALSYAKAIGATRAGAIQTTAAASELLVDSHGGDIANRQSGSAGGIVSSGALEIDAQGGRIDNSQGGTIGAAGSARLSGGRVANQAGSIAANGTLHIHATAGGGILTAATKATEQAEQYSDLAGRAMAVLEPIRGFIMDNLWLILLGIGGFVVYKSDILQKIRLTKHQTGEDVSV